jgi:hypothetical protein
LASQSGSITIVHACGTPRSRTVGIPSGLGRPSGVGRSTRRTGCGLSLPARRSGASAWRTVVPPCRSTSSLCTASMPALPPLARTSRQARHRMSGRHRRPSSAWHRRFLLRLAAWYRVRWSGREGANGGGWPCRAGLVPDPLAALGCSRGPALPARAVVALIARPLTSSDASRRMPLDCDWGLIPGVTAAVGH